MSDSTGAATSPSQSPEKVADGSRRTWGMGPLVGLLPLAALLLVWQLAGSPQSPFFPAPSSWPRALAGLSGEDALAPAVVATLRTVVIALALATLLGAACGLVVGGSRLADRALGPSFEFARALPPAVMVPVATLLLGYAETMKVLVVTIATIWPILLNTRAGVRSVDRTLLDVTRSLRLGHVDRLRKVILPSLLPSITLGLRVAAPITVVITLLVEVITQVNGVGALIAHSQRTFQPARVWALIVVAGALSLGVNMAAEAVERRLFRYRPTS
ncbi:MAG TPA: ABC transporter permease [Acidimicrobiales bacterium]|nr:ABC transporter permease [Acidimicrobiales bacterium]